MRIEAAIFHREDRLDHMTRHLVDGDVNPLFGVERECRLAPPIHHDRRLGSRRDARQVTRTGELAGDGERESDRPVGGIPAAQGHRNYRADEQSLSHAASNDRSQQRECQPDVAGYSG